MLQRRKGGEGTYVSWHGKADAGLLRDAVANLALALIQDLLGRRQLVIAAYGKHAREWDVLKKPGSS